MPSSRYEQFPWISLIVSNWALSPTVSKPNQKSCIFFAHRAHCGHHNRAELARKAPSHKLGIIFFLTRDRQTSLSPYFPTHVKRTARHKHIATPDYKAFYTLLPRANNSVTCCLNQATVWCEYIFSRIVIHLWVSDSFRLQNENPLQTRYNSVTDSHFSSSYLYSLVLTKSTISNPAYTHISMYTINFSASEDMRRFHQTRGRPWYSTTSTYNKHDSRTICLFFWALLDATSYNTFFAYSNVVYVLYTHSPIIWFNIEIRYHILWENKFGKP